MIVGDNDWWGIARIANLNTSRGWTMECIQWADGYGVNAGNLVAYIDRQDDKHFLSGCTDIFSYQVSYRLRKGDVNIGISMSFSFTMQILNAFILPPDLWIRIAGYCRHGLPASFPGIPDKQGSNGVFFGFFIYCHDGAARPVVDKAGEKGEKLPYLPEVRASRTSVWAGRIIGRTFSHSASLQAQG